MYYSDSMTNGSSVKVTQQQTKVPQTFAEAVFTNTADVYLSKKVGGSGYTKPSGTIVTPEVKSSPPTGSGGRTVEQINKETKEAYAAREEMNKTGQTYTAVNEELGINVAGATKEIAQRRFNEKVAEWQRAEESRQLEEQSKRRVVIQTEYGGFTTYDTMAEQIKKEKAAKKTRKESRLDLLPTSLSRYNARNPRPGVVSLSPREAVDVGLISKREYRSVKDKENLRYETTAEDLKKVKEATVKFKEEYPDRPIAPGETRFNKYYRIKQEEFDRENIAIKKQMNNPWTHISQMRRPLEFAGGLTDVAASAMRHEDWRKTYDNILENNIRLSTQRELKVGQIQFLAEEYTVGMAEAGLIAVTAYGGGLVAAGANPATMGIVGKAAVVTSEVVGWSFAANLGERIGSTFVPLIQGQGKIDVYAGSEAFVMSTPLIFAGATKLTRPLAHKAVMRSKSFKGMAGRTKLKTVKKGKVKTKKSLKQEWKDYEFRRAVKRGEYKKIKVQTKKGLKDRIVKTKKSALDKMLDRRVRNIKKQRKIEQRIFHKTKDPPKEISDVFKSRINKKQMTYTDTKQSYTWNKRPSNPFKNILNRINKPTPNYKVNTNTGGKTKSNFWNRWRNWADSQAAGQARIKAKQKIPRAKWKKMQKQAAKQQEIDLLFKQNQDLKSAELLAMQQSTDTLTVTKPKQEEISIFKTYEDQALKLGSLSALGSLQKSASKQDQLSAEATVYANEYVPGGQSSFMPGGGGGGSGYSPPPPDPTPPLPPDVNIIDKIRDPPGYQPPEIPKIEIPELLKTKMPFIERKLNNNRGGFFGKMPRPQMKHTYTASLAGSLFSKPVQKPTFLQSKGFGIRPQLDSWFKTTDKKNKRRRRKK